MIIQFHQRKKSNRTIPNKCIIFHLNLDQIIHILQSEFKTLDWIPNWFYFKMAFMRNDYQNLNVTAKLSIIMMKT